MSNITEQIVRQHSTVQQIAQDINSEQLVYVFSDLNVRDEPVSPSTDVMLYDTKTIIQGIWRLLNTEEGEIPNFRNYGLSVKRFNQYPLSTQTVEAIYEYIKGRIEYFEPRVEVIRADVDANFEQCTIYMLLYLRLRASGEVVQLPLWSIQVSTI